MKKLLITILFCCCFTGCIAFDRASQIEDIREATFRHLLGKMQAKEVCFLAIITPEEKWSDPSDEFMKRFTDAKPRVAKHSDSVSGGGRGVRDKNTGEPGTILKAGKIRWISDEEVEVDGGYYASGLGASANTYLLKKKDGKWIVERDVMRWISQTKGPNQALEPTTMLGTSAAEQPWVPSRVVAHL